MLRALSLEEVAFVSGGMMEDADDFDDGSGGGDGGGDDGGFGDGGDYDGSPDADSGNGTDEGNANSSENNNSAHKPEDPVPGYPTKFSDMTTGQKICYAGYSAVFPAEVGDTGSKTADYACHTNMSGENPNATYKMNPQGK